MDIRNIKTFVSVAELKSFTKAAAQLNYVQSTVTMQIQQLEKELGYPLFDRIGRTVSLTSFGSEFLQHAYEILQAVEKAELINSDAEDINATFRLGVSESLLLGVLNSLLPDFKKRYKNLNISIKTAHTFELIEELKQNRLDMVYISKNANTDPDLKCCYKRKEDVIFVCGREHPLASQKSVTPLELFSHEFLVTEREGICYGMLKGLAASYNMSVIESVEIDNITIITELVRKGVGIAFLPEGSVQRAICDGELFKINAKLEPATYYSQILCHKSRWVSPFMARFIEMIEQSRPQ